MDAARAAEHLDKFTAWGLSHLADCANPDSADSPGARFLAAVRAAVVSDWERLTEREDPDYFGTVPEVVGSCMPSTAHEVWQVFTDLAAYTEDVSGFVLNDMSAAAGHALYRIATRLVYALVREGKRFDTEEGGD